jgi:casein kinase II subunit beta
LVLISLVDDLDEATRVQVEKSARTLYGLVHARYILTNKGLSRMLEKYKNAVFGRCPRSLCGGHPVLPLGLSDSLYVKAVKLYCPNCEDVYNPRAARHQYVDGAFFGTSFPHMLFQVFIILDIVTNLLKVYPSNIPAKRIERYVPRIFGFKIHDISTTTENASDSLVDATKQLLQEPLVKSRNNSSAMDIM